MYKSLRSHRKGDEFDSFIDHVTKAFKKLDGKLRSKEGLIIEKSNTIKFCVRHDGQNSMQILYFKSAKN